MPTGMEMEMEMEMEMGMGEGDGLIWKEYEVGG